ncbi:monofunctional biosynthetic peptidoglycan transglycosylase [Microbaculum marinum]|uniref:Biosynthetic peptidoglycan transglycosylase n=1 Tax=Microbaculum marinum TaxID=1764581 RepID=A0AAW9RLZ8_9HYPH
MAPSTASGGKTSGQKQGDRRARKRSLAGRLFRILVAVVVVLVALPVVLVPLYAVVPPPVSTLELWQRVTGVAVERDWVPLEEIAPNLAYAVIMGEDGRFCEHGGVDWGAVKEVIETDASRGASTITMQVAKNLFLWPSRSYVRKALEVPLAYYQTAVWTKRRTIEIYLNIVEWGPGIFGAEAAARYWFDTSAAKLTLQQAARLAAILPNPHLRNASRPGPQTSRYAQIIEGRTRQAGAYVQCIRSAG